MAVRLTGTFYDINGAEYQVDIHDADFVGSATDFDVKYCRISYDSDKNDDTTSPIIGSRAEVGMTVPITDTTLQTFIEDFAEGAENRFFVEITKVLTSLVIWRGILTPDFTGEEDTAPLYVFKVSATCGLATLKKKPYHDGSAIYTGIERLTKHLTKALSKIVHTDTFWNGTDIFLKTAVDWWSVSMASGADDDALFQGGVDNSAFYDYKTQGGVDKDVLSSWDVLWHILKTFNCRIFQNEGVWWVEQIPYRTASPYYTRHYEKDGDFIASATNSGANVIDQTRTGAKLATMNYDFLPALEKAVVNYDVKIRRNFLNGQNLTTGFDTINFDQAISSNGGDAICRIKGQISFGVKNLSYTGGANDVLFLVPNFRLKIGANYLKRTYTISNFNAQLGTLEWTTNAADVVTLPHNLGVVPAVGAQTNGTINFEILAPALPSDGDDNQFLLEVQDMSKWNGSGVNNSEFQIFWSASNLFLEIYDDGTPIINEDQVEYTATNPDEFSEVYETTVRLGTATLANSAGRLFRWGGAAWLNATDWGQGVGTRNKAIGDLLALNILNARLTPLRRLNGTLLGDFRMHRLIQTSDGKKWMFANATWDVGGNTLQGTWFQLDYGTAGVSSTPIKKKVIPNGPTYPPIPDPTNPTGLTNTSSGFNINPAPTVLAPVSYNQLDGEIDAGDTVTSIPIKTASAGNEFLAGDGVTLVNPFTGEFQTFSIATAPTAGATSLSVTSEVSDYDFPEDSYLVVKQNAYSFRLPQGTAEGQILRWDNVAEEWEVYSGTTDGHVLTWDTTNGWQAEASTGGGGNYQTLRDAGAGMAQRAAANFVDTGRIAFTLTDDAGNNETEITAEIIDNSVSDAKLRTGAAASVIGRSAATGGNVADIASTANHQVLKRDDTGALIWGLISSDNISDNAVTTAKIADNAVTNAKLRQGVARSVIGVTGNATANVADIQGTADQVLRVDSAGTALAFGQVATGGIANDAVTYAKIQNVSATNRVLGRITAGAGDVEELTQANLYTLMGMTGVSNRLAIWTGANTLTSDAAFTIDAGNDRMTITGTIAGLGANNAILNINTGAIAGATEFLRMSGNITSNLIAGQYNANNAAVGAHCIYSISTGGANGGDPVIQFIVAGQTTHAIGTDNSDADKFKITPTGTTPGGVANCGIILTNAAAPNIGINKDAPQHALDIAGKARARVFMGKVEEWAVGNFTAGAALNGGGSITAASGIGNAFIITFSTGTTPANNAIIFTCNIPAAIDYPWDCYPVFSPANKAAADEGDKFYVPTRSGNSFTFQSSGTLTASTSFSFLFHIWGGNNAA